MTLSRELAEKAELVAHYEGLLAQLAAKLTAEAAAREADMVRRAYRRGYLAGRSSERRGADLVTNPERTARGWVREALR